MVRPVRALPSSRRGSERERVEGRARLSAPHKHDIIRTNFIQLVQTLHNQQKHYLIRTIARPAGRRRGRRRRPRRGAPIFTPPHINIIYIIYIILCIIYIYIMCLEVGDEGGGGGHDAARALVECRQALLRPLRLRRRQLPRHKI